MLYAGLDSIGKTSLALGLISQKQRKLSANLANMDTPGYIRQDLDFASYLGTGELETRMARKMGPCPVFPDYEQEEINAADELTQMQRNSILYTVASRRMSNIIKQMKTVINVGK